MKKIDRSSKVRTGFHQAKWDEPVIFELSVKGERGIIVPKAEKAIEEAIGDGVSSIPQHLRRKTPPALPEISQPRVLRHYMRLSQQTLGADVNIEIGQGTCTVKYSPKINEQVAREQKMSELHPEQPEETVQGILEIMYTMGKYMEEISGMHRFSFQPGGGSQAIMALAAIVRDYFEDKGEADKRDEIITTVYSHPSDAAAPAVFGYKIIKLFPGEDGLPDLEAVRSAVSERTAALFIANPEDTGIYNGNIEKITAMMREAGALSCYDQANANGLLGVTRAKEAGFDMCFFNLHKTFSNPHGCGGPATGAIGVREELEKFLPVPLVGFKDGKYFLDYGADKTIGMVRAYSGVAQNVLKSYMWIRSLGAEGLYEAAKIAVLNNNYLYKKLMEIRCVSAPYNTETQRIEQVRYTLEKLTEDTGITAGDIQRRMMDFGMHFWNSHHPYYIPEPMTLEPTETPSKEDLDEYIETLRYVFEEAYSNPEIIHNAPHRSVTHRLDESHMDDPKGWALTWEGYLKKFE